MDRLGLPGCREMLEKGSDDIGSAVCYTILYTNIGSAVCYTILYTVYINLWTQAADPILSEHFSRIPLYLMPIENTVQMRR